jgi:putative FmdB family regulatory protein
MPTYEYECEACGERFEYFQRITESPKTTCERCGGRLEKLLSAGSGLIFKGSGFYITDYKRGNGSSKSSSESKSEKSEKSE